METHHSPITLLINIDDEEVKRICPLNSTFFDLRVSGLMRITLTLLVLTYKRRLIRSIIRT